MADQDLPPGSSVDTSSVSDEELPLNQLGANRHVESSPANEGTPPMTSDLQATSGTPFDVLATKMSATSLDISTSPPGSLPMATSAATVTPLLPAADSLSSGPRVHPSTADYTLPSGPSPQQFPDGAPLLSQPMLLRPPGYPVPLPIPPQIPAGFGPHPYMEQPLSGFPSIPPPDPYHQLLTQIEFLRGDNRNLVRLLHGKEDEIASLRGQVEQLTVRNQDLTRQVAAALADAADCKTCVRLQARISALESSHHSDGPKSHRIHQEYAPPRFQVMSLSSMESSVLPISVRLTDIPKLTSVDPHVFVKWIPTFFSWVQTWRPLFVAAYMTASSVPIDDDLCHSQRSSMRVPNEVPIYDVQNPAHSPEIQHQALHVLIQAVLSHDEAHATISVPLSPHLPAGHAWQRLCLRYFKTNLLTVISCLSTIFEKQQPTESGFAYLSRLEASKIRLCRLLPEAMSPHLLSAVILHGLRMPDYQLTLRSLLADHVNTLPTMGSIRAHIQLSDATSVQQSASSVESPTFAPTTLPPARPTSLVNNVTTDDYSPADGPPTSICFICYKKGHPPPSLLHWQWQCMYVDPEAKLQAQARFVKRKSKQPKDKSKGKAGPAKPSVTHAAVTPPVDDFAHDPMATLTALGFEFHTTAHSPNGQSPSVSMASSPFTPPQYTPPVSCDDEEDDTWITAFPYPGVPGPMLPSHFDGLPPTPSSLLDCLLRSV